MDTEKMNKVMDLLYKTGHLDKEKILTCYPMSSEEADDLLETFHGAGVIDQNGFHIKKGRGSNATNISFKLAIITSLIALFLIPEGTSFIYTASVLIAGIGNYFWGSWTMSNRIGSSTNLSTALKGSLSLIDLYAMVGIVVNIYHICIWLY